MIDSVTITIFSENKTMKRNHLLCQPRRILESKLLKHISNSDLSDKIRNYKFLSTKYELL